MSLADARTAPGTRAADVRIADVRAAGEYGYDPGYFRRMLDAHAVDVLQADVTRACGIPGLQSVAALCIAYETPLSAHCAPQIHAHAGAERYRV